MIKVVYFILLFNFGNCYIPIPSMETAEDRDLSSCVTGIINKYFVRPTGVTYVSVRDDDTLLNAINALNLVSVFNRKYVTGLRVKWDVRHEWYIVSSDSVIGFIEQVVYLTIDANWNPYAKFLIILRDINEEELEFVFDELLEQRIHNAILINTSEGADIYTYNPYDNYNCGKRYDQITRIGKCLDVQQINLFPEKIVTGLRNCTIVVGTTIWPPYSKVMNLTRRDEVPGVDQFAVLLLGDIEHFKIEFSYKVSLENYSMIGDNMTATGSLNLLQNNKFDMLMGGFVLTIPRMSAFNYLSWHTMYTDDLRIFVKKANYNPTWKSMYLELDPVVWILIGVSFIGYSVLVILFLPDYNWDSLILKMFDSFFQHSMGRIRGRYLAKFIIAIWSIFTFIVSCYYQSIFVSVISHPTRGFQITTESEVEKYGLKKCYSNNMRSYLSLEIGYDTETNLNDDEKCHNMLDSLQVVSSSHDSHTILPHFVYYYNQHAYYDNWGESKIHTISEPINKIIYAIYLNKGFPMYKRLQTHTIRFMQYGLMKKCLRDLHYEMKLKYLYSKKPFQRKLWIPWPIYGLGMILGFISFVCEIAVKIIHRR